jgi:hypothetical protein
MCLSEPVLFVCTLTWQAAAYIPETVAKCKAGGKKEEEERPTEVKVRVGGQERCVCRAVKRLLYPEGFLYRDFRRVVTRTPRGLGCVRVVSDAVKVDSQMSCAFCFPF